MCCIQTNQVGTARVLAPCLRAEGNCSRLQTRLNSLFSKMSVPLSIPLQACSPQINHTGSATRARAPARPPARKHPYTSHLSTVTGACLSTAAVSRALSRVAKLSTSSPFLYSWNSGTLCGFVCFGGGGVSRGQGCDGGGCHVSVQRGAGSAVVRLAAAMSEAAAAGCVAPRGASYPAP